MSRSKAETKQPVKLIHDVSEIPEFKDEAEERAYWETHGFSYEIFDKVTAADEPPLRLPPRPKTVSKSITLRLDSDIVTRLKALAHEKEVPYQTLLKRFVTERLYEEERRAGLIPKKRKAPPRDTHDNG
ncbi:MAG TPA: CopG family antitoxin [Trueperaceae bacterium]|nr:CopG family antitoxin [Trueperaceae bacterium]